MATPFLGMDPYLEAHWLDIHSRLVIYASDALQDTLPGSLRARVEERVLLETSEGKDASFFPDVRIIEFGPKSSREKSGGALAVAELILAKFEQPTERYIEIIDTSTGNRVVTVIEFLSPSNKLQGETQDRYLFKQKENIASRTNLVEIDLNRTGHPTMLVNRTELLPKHRTSYMACVRRATKRGRIEVYPIDIRHRLPIIAIPLRPKDEDVTLDLQQLIDQCYRRGGYDGTLDYGDDPDPPLRRQDAEWVDQLLIEQGFRESRKAPRRKKKTK